jgi:hypothetical protein
VKNPHQLALLVAFTALLGESPPPARADTISTGLKHCAAIAGAEARLACYDTLSGRANQGASSSALPAAAVPAATAAAAIPAAAASSPAAPTMAPVAPPDPAEAARNFGLSTAQLHTAPQGPQSIEAHVSQVSVDRSLRSLVVLDNGETWASTDGGLELNTGELITIKRAALGSFMLVSTTSKHSYHVRRVL